MLCSCNIVFDFAAASSTRQRAVRGTDGWKSEQQVWTWLECRGGRGIQLPDHSCHVRNYFLKRACAIQMVQGWRAVLRLIVFLFLTVTCRTDDLEFEPAENARRQQKPTALQIFKLSLRKFYCKFFSTFLICAIHKNETRRCNYNYNEIFGDRKQFAVLLLIKNKQTIFLFCFH
jgi:hypothetical protein